MTIENLFICGGAHSGKTSRAFDVASSFKQVTWVGTASPAIPEIAKRITELRHARPSHWQQFDCPIDLPRFLEANTAVKSSDILVIDSVSQWISNELAINSVKFDDQQLTQWLCNEVNELMHTLQKICRLRPMIVVSSDFSQTFPPTEPQLRILRYVNGISNQTLAKSASKFEILQCGLVTFRSP